MQPARGTGNRGVMNTAQASSPSLGTPPYVVKYHKQVIMVYGYILHHHHHHIWCNIISKLDIWWCITSWKNAICYLHSKEKVSPCLPHSFSSQSGLKNCWHTNLAVCIYIYMKHNLIIILLSPSSSLSSSSSPSSSGAQQPMFHLHAEEICEYQVWGLLQIPPVVVASYIGIPVTEAPRTLMDK